MQPRIATLLGESAAPNNRTTLDPISLPPPPSVPLQRPHPVEPSPVGDDVRSDNATRHIGNDSYASSAQGIRIRSKASAPLAGVLNNEAPPQYGPQWQPAISTGHSAPYAVPFSGRLSAILLDPSQEQPNKRRKVDERATQPGAPVNENTMLTLPKLPQLPKKTARRPRIPPLLQGLHQPPPLPPEGRLFPPITGETRAFGRALGEDVGLPSSASGNRDEEEEKDKEEEISTRSAVVGATTEKDNLLRKQVLSASASKENSSQEVNTSRPAHETSKAKETRKRNKWSDQETKDLLHGVSRFGIGNWKRILNCPDFHFNHRTAVDLKDRFRTCCPGEGTKTRKPKSKGATKDSSLKEPEGSSSGFVSIGSGSSQELPPPAMSTESPKRARKPRGDTHRKGPEELAEMGIQAPFFKSNRRQRREFTNQDDENLFKGFEKFGPVWHEIRNDPTLGFNARHSTDLRDRFRIRYPELYSKLGYKLKPKDELMLKEKEKEDTSSQELAAAVNSKQKPKSPVSKSLQTVTSEPPSASLKKSSSSNTGLRAHALLQPLLGSFQGSFDDFSEMMSEDDGENGRSPVTLNRNIFQWADANPSSTVPTTFTFNIPPATGDLGLSSFYGMDGMHIDPRATLKLPVASSNTNPLAATSSYLSSSSSNLLNLPNTSANTNTTSTSAPHAASTGMSSAAKQNMSSLLRTPNLPTIVYPHVPAASARAAMHNLPPPADLLSGLEVEVRTESQATGFVLDDTLGMNFATSSGTNTLAPMVGSGTERGIFTLDRGLLEEPFGERSLLNSSI